MHYFSPLNTLLRKGKDPEPDPHPWLMDPVPDPGGPKAIRILRLYCDGNIKMQDFYLWNSLYLPRNVSLSETTMEEPRLSSKSELLKVPAKKQYKNRMMTKKPWLQTCFKNPTTFLINTVSVPHSDPGHFRLKITGSGFFLYTTVICNSKTRGTNDCIVI